MSAKWKLSVISVVLAVAPLLGVLIFFVARSNPNLNFALAPSPTATPAIVYSSGTIIEDLNPDTILETGSIGEDGISTQYIEGDLAIEPDITEANNLKIDFSLLNTKLEEIRSKNNLDIYFHLTPIGSTGTFGLNESKKTGMLSVIKMSVMLATYEKLQKGEITKATAVSRYGYSGTVSSALKAMMINSSNEATGALILGVGGVSYVNKVVDSYLLNNNLALAHTPNYAEGGTNYSSPVDYTGLLNLIYTGTVLPAANQKEMQDLLVACSDYFGLKDIPTIAYIAQKTGYYPSSQWALAAYIKNNKGSEYAVSLKIAGKKNQTISKGLVKQIIQAVEASHY